MTIKENIIRELLDSVGDGARLEEVFRRYSRNKGPFYLGLAEATSQLEARFEETVQEVFESESSRQTLQEELVSLEERRHCLEDHVQAVSRQVETKEERLAEVQGVLDLAVDLERRGFGQEELNRLYELLAQIAADSTSRAIALLGR